MSGQSFESLLAALAASDQTAKCSARDALVTAAIDHMRAVAHRMIRGYPQVRRWEETDDVVQGACLRLARALDTVIPTDAWHLLNLIATQVRRELIDLARRYAGAESFARYHETNRVRVDGREVFRSDAVTDPESADVENARTWTRLHEVASTLDEEEQKLFNLVWYLGLSQEQSAKVLGCSVRTVARRWNVLKRRLVAHLEGKAPT